MILDPDAFVEAASDEERASFFVQQLLIWYSDKKRDLPWRKTRDPYAIWVSEMMLQQTLVATVIAYWTRWMERFPTVQSLADAPLEDVLKQWQGLGYYARARNMHRAAQVIIEKHAAEFPTRFDDVLDLPGIGRYTAGAICSIALGQDVPIVDANVIRVLCRYFGLHGDPKSTSVQAKLWKLAEDLIPTGRANSFNQGVMELGALVCTARPQCGVCPMNTKCFAFETGRQDALPEFAPRPVFTTQTDVSAIVSHTSGDGRLLLIRRPAEGLWGGLWEFPRVTAAIDESVAEAAQRAALTICGLDVTAIEENRLGSVKHGVTTHKITLIGVGCQMRETQVPQALACDAVEWVAPERLNRFALSSPQARLVSQILGHIRQPALF